MYSLRTLSRILFVVWLLLVLGLGGIVAYSAAPSKNSRTLLALFLPHKDPLPSQRKNLPEKPRNEDEPVQKEVTAPSEWTPLEKGYTHGKGTLSNIEVLVLDNEDVEVRFATTDTPGAYQDFLPHNVEARSVDLMGSMGKGLFVNRRLERGILKRLQIADHKNWLRISGIARNQKLRITARVEYAKSLQRLRIVFSPESR